ncbi:MAG: hypothetical protein ACSLE5_13890 [Porticoccaceae bacterium]
MSSNNEIDNSAEPDQVADAIAAVVIVAIVVISAVFWVASH